jgi:hypothetical protein
MRSQVSSFIQAGLMLGSPHSGGVVYKVIINV